MFRHFCCLLFVAIGSLSFAQGIITPVNSGTKEHFRSVFFIDQKQGFIVGNNGSILQTLDAGKTWKIKPSIYKEFLYDVGFFGKKVGFIAGGNFEDEAVILKSKDFGETWEFSFRLKGVSAFLALKIINEKVVYVCGYNGAILKTTNGGLTWSSQRSTTKERLQGMSFINEQMGWAVGTKGTILFTKDGGKIWQAQESKTNENLESVHFLNQNVGYVTGNNGIILSTKDGGLTWTKQRSFTSEPLHAVKFINEKVGWAVGGYLCNGKIPTIVHTSNGGELWQSNESPVLIPLNSLFFNSNNQGYVVGLQGTILKLDLNSYSEKAQKVSKNEVSNFPNPFSDETAIRFYLEEESDVELGIFNMIGEEILTIKKTKQAKGFSQITWDGKLKNGKQAPTGLYYYKVKIKNQKEVIEETRKMVMVK